MSNILAQFLVESLDGQVRRANQTANRQQIIDQPSQKSNCIGEKQVYKN